eukprot:1425506-Pyramimonas_sp.AAC.1
MGLFPRREFLERACNSCCLACRLEGPCDQGLAVEMPGILYSGKVGEEVQACRNTSLSWVATRGASLEP